MNKAFNSGFAPGISPNPTCMLPIIVGAGPRAEISDRPLAQAVQQAIQCEATGELHPIILTDLWYLNDRDLLVQPSIVIGDPEQNAASAFHAPRLPTILLVEEHYRILMDQDGGIGHACMWGSGHDATISAVSTFVDRFLSLFLSNALLRTTVSGEH
jgi:hypothetical protein